MGAIIIQTTKTHPLKVVILKYFRNQMREGESPQTYFLSEIWEGGKLPRGSKTFIIFSQERRFALYGGDYPELS